MCRWLWLIWSVACSSAVVRGPAPSCRSANPGLWLQRAAASVEVVPYRSKWCNERQAEAVVSYPAPERFAGGPRDFGQLRHRSFVYDNALLDRKSTRLNSSH